MYSHGPHMDVTDLELSPIVEMWLKILRLANSSKNNIFVTSI
jgi:hypothetical protein